MKKEKFALPAILLEIASHFPENPKIPGEEPESAAPRDPDNPNLKRKINRLRKKLPDYTLTDEEICLISILFERFLDRERKVSATELADRLYPGSVQRLHALKVIRGLVVKELLDTRGISLSFRDSEPRTEEKFSLVKVVDSEVLFREAFLQDLLGERRLRQRHDNKPFRNNREFLEAWFAYIKALSDYRRTRSLKLDEFIDTSEESDAIRDSRATLERRLALTGTAFPLQELVREEGLDDNERNVIVYLLREELSDNDCTVSELVDFLSEDSFEQHRVRGYFEPQSKLVARGIVELAENSFLKMKRAEIRLSPDVSRRLLSREPGDDRERIAQILRGQDILELAKPWQSFDDLVVPDDLRHSLKTAIKRYESDVDSRLRQWGIERDTTRRMVYDRDEAPLLMLFCGPSGTGKTFAAGAFARQMGRELLITDISKLLSAWVGESEQNVRRLFYLFDRLVRRCDTPPVLLLNECDQFLTRRMDSSRSVDRMYHQMQNLFLEGFEQLRGILVATTNLVGHIDSAFSRRFHLKLEFPMPDVKERERLWTIHLPETLPRDGSVDVAYLAGRYEFSGGQIALVVRNAAIEAAVRGGELTLDDLTRACEIELSGAQKVVGGFKGTIGF